MLLMSFINGRDTMLISILVFRCLCQANGKDKIFILSIIEIQWVLWKTDNQMYTVVNSVLCCRVGIMCKRNYMCRSVYQLVVVLDTCFIEWIFILLQDLPVPTPVEMGIPTENFADAVTIVEFLNSFSFLFDVEEELGGTITLGINTDLDTFFEYQQKESCLN